MPRLPVAMAFYQVARDYDQDRAKDDLTDNNLRIARAADTKPGEWVYEGDRLVEILAGPATFDVSAQATGRLLERFALANDPVSAGQVLGTLEEEPDPR